MVVHIPKYPEEYANIFQLTGLLVATEFMVTVQNVKLYNPESAEWSLRRLFWYLALGIPALFSITSITAAAVKFLAR